mmetsp:Transcript_36757/g.118214  ORF Transcript_36757/g.118214 Transcript_36757/m.118214 type:complete len:306 (-) Transcript_36757:1250-2167(-)|eukprot:scaffold26543_cov101-Isochrysis_galbana.AAC.4
MLRSASAAARWAPGADSSAASSGRRPATASQRVAWNDDESSLCVCHSLITSSSEVSSATVHVLANRSSPRATPVVCTEAALAGADGAESERSQTACAAPSAAARTGASLDQTSVSISAGRTASRSKAWAATRACIASSTSEFVWEPSMALTTARCEETRASSASAWSSRTRAACFSATLGESACDTAEPLADVAPPAAGVPSVAPSSPSHPATTSSAPLAPGLVTVLRSGLQESLGLAICPASGVDQPSGICARMASRRAARAGRFSAAQKGLNSSSLAYSCSAPRRTLAFLSASRARPSDPACK